MNYNEDEELDGGFKMGGDDEDEPLDMPEDTPDLDDDPEDRYH